MGCILNGLYIKCKKSLNKLELVYLPKGKYCVYPRMVYRLAPGIMTFFTFKMTLRVIPHPSYLGKDSFHTEEAT